MDLEHSNVSLQLVPTTITRKYQELWEKKGENPLIIYQSIYVIYPTKGLISEYLLCFFSRYSLDTTNTKKLRKKRIYSGMEFPV